MAVACYATGPTRKFLLCPGRCPLAGVEMTTEVELAQPSKSTRRSANVPRLGVWAGSWARK
jgi:hypothetical protein